MEWAVKQHNKNHCRPKGQHYLLMNGKDLDVLTIEEFVCAKSYSNPIVIP